MAALPEQDRAETWAELMRSADCPGGVTKPQLRAALDAPDDWADANAASFNAALPQPFRGTATARQKAALLMYVISRRHKVT